MPTTMALRFRDLVGPPNSTIQRHEELIANSAKKRVWWGWWSKPQEKVPFAVFAEFSKLANGAGLQVFLVDSGQEKLYSAKIDQIFYSPADQLEPTPDSEHTPAYYKTEKYKAWFRFSKIEENKKDLIRNWSYDEVPDFTEDPTEERFHGKKVWNLAELLNRRHRTIYFLTETAPKDPDYQVELVPPAPPRDFLDTPLLCATNWILHISDLHLGDEHAFPTVPDQHEQNLGSVIKSSLEASGLNPRPSVIVVSGDLTWLGTSEEFEQARRTVSQLAVSWGLDPGNVVFCPGNHDMQWGPPAAPYDSKAKVVCNLEEASKNYDTFFKNFYGIEPNKWGAMARRYVLKNTTSVDVIAVNSSILEQDQFRGYGLVTFQQLAQAFKSLDWPTSEDRSHFRFLVLHHHLVPVVAQEAETYQHNFSLTLDAAQIIHETGLAGVDIILHGHQHQPFLSFVERENSRVLIIGAGSAGVKQKHIPKGSTNAFNLYALTNRDLTIYTFALSENTTRFEVARTVRVKRTEDNQLHFAK